MKFLLAGLIMCGTLSAAEAMPAMSVTTDVSAVPTIKAAIIVRRRVVRRRPVVVVRRPVVRRRPVVIVR